MRIKISRTKQQYAQSSWSPYPNEIKDISGYCYMEIDELVDFIGKHGGKAIIRTDGDSASIEIVDVGPEHWKNVEHLLYEWQVWDE